MGCGRGSRASVSRVPLHGSSARRSQRRFGSRVSLVDTRGTARGGLRLEARGGGRHPVGCRFFGGEGRPRSLRGPRGRTQPREVAGRRRRVSKRFERVGFGLRLEHGTGESLHRRATSREANRQLGRHGTLTRLRLGGGARSPPPGSKPTRFGVEGTTRGPKHAGSCPEGRMTLQNPPSSLGPVVRHRALGARVETIDSGCTRGEGKGASGSWKPCRSRGEVKAAWANGSRPEVTSRDRRADTDGHCVLSGARAPSTDAHRAEGEEIGDEASEVRRTRRAGKKRSASTRRLAEASVSVVNPRAPVPRGMWRGVVRDSGEPVLCKRNRG
jgi:hypothetical protein